MLRLIILTGVAMAEIAMGNANAQDIFSLEDSLDTASTSFEDDDEIDAMVELRKQENRDAIGEFTSGDQLKALAEKPIPDLSVEEIGGFESRRPKARHD